MAKDFIQRIGTIVLAGGQGTRLYPLTAHRCKPAVTFGGHYRLIDIPLSNSLNAGISQIFVISQHFAADLHQHILSTYQFDMFRDGRLELLTPQEAMGQKSWFKGTADAVRQNLPFILKCSAEYFLILSGDQLYNMDLLEMLRFTEQKQADLVVASLPVSNSEAKRMGLMKVSRENLITNFAEKPKDPAILKQYELPSGRHLASMGIYIFKREALISLLEQEGDDFGCNLIPRCMEKGHVFAYPYEGYWEDIGTIGSYYRANLLLTDNQGLDLYQEEQRIYSRPQNVPNARIGNTRMSRSIISGGATIDAEEISHSIVGLRCKVEKGTVIKDSIINGHRSYHPFLEKVSASGQHFSIGKDCLIEKTIVDEEALIGNRVKLINREKLEHYDGEGIYVRDGIVVVTSGTELPDDFVF